MRIYGYPFDTVPPVVGRCVIALGLFDGVHLAHRRILECARARARELGAVFGVFTFRSDGAIKSSAERIYTDEEKRVLLSDLGAEIVIEADFTAIRDVSPEDFVQDILIDSLGCECCVAGFNFRFGKGAHGDADSLARLMSECGREALIVDEQTVDGVTVSSTLIRSLLRDGKIDEANRLLTSPYFILGRVEHGNRVGRGLGYPTLNLPLAVGRSIPRLGVYRSAVEIDGVLYSAVTNIGRCPTFDEREIHAEAHIIGELGEIYGRSVRLYLLEFLREERKFGSADELTRQIETDKNQTIKENGELKWQVHGQSLQ